jgi:hypothetical protein
MKNTFLEVATFRPSFSTCIKRVGLRELCETLKGNIAPCEFGARNVDHPCLARSKTIHFDFSLKTFRFR